MTVFHTAIQSLVLSAIFCIGQWLFYFIGLCDNGASWSKFFWGAVCLFIILSVVYASHTAITMYRMYKDPVFKYAHLRLGLSWKQYKEIKDKDNIVK